MSDATPPKLAAGSLVLCYFPEEQAPFDVGPKARPALVLRVFRRTSDDSRWVEVAYASTQRTSANGAALKPHEFEIDPSANPASHLTQTTRFDLERRTALPWNDTWFKAPGAERSLRPFGQISDADLARAKALAASFPSRQLSFNEKASQTPASPMTTAQEPGQST